ncbi:MAG: hypothetical protein Q4G27_03140 [Flavobacteriaceae bacterium]|nr:hypothetical protein [Flavobacteriaceae bacterium]
MEVKKTDKASLKGNNTLYFLGGLNLVLLIVWGLFSYTQAPEKIEIAPPQEIVETTEAVLIEIPEPETPPPPPPPADEPPPPPPPAVPQEIIETPEPVPPPPIAEQKHTPPPIQTGPVATGPVKKVDLSGLKTKTEEAPKEERVTEPVTVNRVRDMAVYPGCEKKKGDKRELVNCFSEMFSKDILRFLDPEFPNVNKERVSVQLEFVVNTDGYIEKINPIRGDEIFKPEAKRALERAAEDLRRKNRRIEPAKMADGSKAPLIFQNNVVLQNPDY